MPIPERRQYLIQLRIKPVCKDKSVLSSLSWNKQPKAKHNRRAKISKASPASLAYRLFLFICYLISFYFLFISQSIFYLIHPYENNSPLQHSFLHACLPVFRHCLQRRCASRTDRHGNGTAGRISRCLTRQDTGKALS